MSKCKAVLDSQKVSKIVVKQKEAASDTQKKAEKKSG